ncbi:unnamed protein product [Cuscuta campestris]|uniref:Uncharacterized protein n=1 Tax=Cuscuta campestris TaxID=132261 RepID=A0A484L343_9ASTE|nr:unnamed protein product [Cuscuta campestris]
MVLKKRFSVNNNNNNKEKASTYETLKKVDDQEHIRGENEGSIIFSIREFLLHKLQIKGTKEGRSALQISPAPPAPPAARVVFHNTAAGAMGCDL